MRLSYLFHGILWLFVSQSIASEDGIQRLAPSSSEIPQATRATGALLWTTQILPRPDSGDALAPQFADCFEQLQKLLAGHKSSTRQIVRLHLCCSSSLHLQTVLNLLPGLFPMGEAPAVSAVVSTLPRTALVALDATALSTATNEEVQLADDIALLPQGTRIFIAGQAESADNPSDATRKTLQSLQRTLEFLGRTNADIVQLKAFVQPMAEAGKVKDEVTRFYSGRRPPPLVLVEWKSSATVPIEIELVAWGGPAAAGAPAIEYLTPPFMTASPVYSRIARTSHPSLIFTGGLQYKATAPAAATADAGSEESAVAEVTGIFSNLSALLNTAGSDFEHLAKATYYVSAEPVSMSLNKLRPRYYNPSRPPAASKAMVTAVGSGPVTLSIDMIAVPASERP